jgi:hypothetical protein
MLGARQDWQGPLETYLPLCNLGLAAVLLLGAIRDRARQDEIWPSWLVPAIILGFSFLGRRIMGSVDISELEKLKYKYKGA